MPSWNPIDRSDVFSWSIQDLAFNHQEGLLQVTVIISAMPDRCHELAAWLVGVIEFNRGKVCSDRGMEPVWMISREPKPACRYPMVVSPEPWSASWQPRTLQDAGAVHRAVPLRC